MNYYSTDRFGRIFALSLEKGDDVLESVNNLISRENIQAGVLVSGVGTVDNCILHFVTKTDDASSMYFREWKDTPLEVTSVQGIIADGKPHIHAQVSNTTGSWGGHLELGCKALYFFEIMIVETPNFNLTRCPRTTDVNNSEHLIMKLVEKENC